MATHPRTRTGAAGPGPSHMRRPCLCRSGRGRPCRLGWRSLGSRRGAGCFSGLPRRRRRSWSCVLGWLGITVCRDVLARRVAVFARWWEGGRDWHRRRHRRVPKRLLLHRPRVGERLGPAVAEPARPGRRTVQDCVRGWKRRLVVDGVPGGSRPSRARVAVVVGLGNGRLFRPARCAVVGRSRHWDRPGKTCSPLFPLSGGGQGSLVVKASSACRWGPALVLAWAAVRM